MRPQRLDGRSRLPSAAPGHAGRGGRRKNPPLHDYYALHPNRDDGGYLPALVDECRRLRRLPAYAVVRDRVRRLVGLYNDLQVYKHGPLERREPALAAWFARRAGPWRDLYWWEFAAACGSTLAVFALFAAAAHRGPDPAAAAQLEEAYFPWICGLHILLDYLIDQAEDRPGATQPGELLPDRLPRAAAPGALRPGGPGRGPGRCRTGSFTKPSYRGCRGCTLSDGKVPQQRLKRWR